MNKKFWVDAGERAVKTFAQAAVAILLASSAGLLGVDWLQLISVAGLSAVISIGTSVASGRVGDQDSAAFIQQEEEV